MRILLPFGFKPPQNKIPNLSSINDMLLYSAWVHGMDETAMIYRRTLFHYIQTHIAAKTQQGLQSTLNNSEYFTTEGEEKGQYCLTRMGLERMLEQFGQPHENLPRNWDYEFTISVGSHTISLYSDWSAQRNIYRLNEHEYTASEIIRKLKQDNLYNSPRKEQDSLLLFDFILSKEFSWRIINFPILSDVQNDNRIKEEEIVFKEGKEYYALHRKKERNGDLVKLAKSIWMANDPLLRCQICDFSFKDQYGELGEGYIEAHHIAPLSELENETTTKVEDLLMVCSNCHKMLHIKRPWQTHEQLINKLSKSWRR